MEMIPAKNREGRTQYVGQGQDGRWRIYWERSGIEGSQDGSYATETEAREELKKPLMQAGFNH